MPVHAHDKINNLLNEKLDLFAGTEKEVSISVTSTKFFRWVYGFNLLTCILAFSLWSFMLLFADMNQ